MHRPAVWDDNGRRRGVLTPCLSYTKVTPILTLNILQCVSVLVNGFPIGSCFVQQPCVVSSGMAHSTFIVRGSVIKQTMTAKSKFVLSSFHCCPQRLCYFLRPDFGEQTSNASLRSCLVCPAPCCLAELDAVLCTHLCMHYFVPLSI